MKTKIFLFFGLLISLLGSTQVKADTIYVQLPGGIQNFCVDTNNYPTFVLYKPNGFGGTVWFLNSQYYGTGDSIIYTPTSIGSYDFGANWDGNVEGVLLRLYSQVPAHATFSVSSGGSMNASGDTAWMCDASVVVSSNTSTLESTYHQWVGPGGFTSTNLPVTITNPGMYYFERGNPCGVTRDTFEVVQLPLSAPVWADTSFCNTPVALTLDPGPGWHYAWNTGATTQTLVVDTAGYYEVQLSNACMSGSVSITVGHEDYPVPDLGLYSTIPSTILCHNEVAILDPDSDYTYTTYAWYNGTTLVGNQSTLTVDYALGYGNYSVEVTQGNCSAISGDVWVYFYSDPMPPRHCVSTFDPLTSTNMTVFEVNNDPDIVDYILMYKQGSTWIPIDTILETGLSSYTLYDEINDPNQQSYTYAVFARHSCGHLSSLGDWHKTIRISIFQDIVSGDYILQILDDYETLSGYVPDSYTIWIDSLNNGNFAQIGILNGGNASFTITSPVTGAAYYASVNLPWNCSGAKSSLEAFSNRKLFNITDVSENPIFRSLSIYPNPSDGIFRVEGVDISHIEIMDQIGSVIATFDNTTIIDLSGFASGVYTARISNDQGSTNRKLVVY